MAYLYAQQLYAEGDIRKAVSYALISGSKGQAVEMFSSQQLHRESVVLARCLYPDGSTQVQESLSRWAGKAVQDGNLELATKCFLANGEVAEAARTLARRSDPLSLKVSADLATGAGLDQLAAAYLEQASNVVQTVNETSPTEDCTEDQSIDQTTQEAATNCKTDCEDTLAGRLNDACIV